MYVSKGIVTLIKYSRKRQAILGTVEENLDVSAGLSKFSATRWAVWAKCFKQILENYSALQETCKGCLQKAGLIVDVKLVLLAVKQK